MSDKCEKCGATTRWYDENCPRCGTARSVELPAAPIALPNFSSLAPTFRETTRTQDPATEQTKIARDDPATEETKIARDAPATEQTKIAQDDPATEQTKIAQDAPTAEETKIARDDPATEQTKIASTRSRRFSRLKRAVDVWRANFRSETTSVTISRTRAARYALGIAAELFVAPPCALAAAYFFTQALRADRQADYHEAINQAEKARLALGAGLFFFALILCGFIFYVQSQEIKAPTLETPNSQIFKR